MFETNTVISFKMLSANQNSHTIHLNYVKSQKVLLSINMFVSLRQILYTFGIFCHKLVST